MSEQHERLARALERWARDDPETYRRVWLSQVLDDAVAAMHGAAKPPPVDVLLEPDPDIYLATAELHDPCSGDCEGICECDESGA